jgi:tetratricopeptide (TPR) repeat protein
MTSKLRFVLGAIGCAFLLAAFRLAENVKHVQANGSKKNVISCSPNWEQLQSWMDENEIPPIPGAGNYAWNVTTNNDSAQFYFNQGINMYYAFHIIEAMASFQKAARFDPGSAMMHWAKALAYGPNINDLGYTASPEALEAAGRAVELSANCSEKEKMLIRAQRARYSDDTSTSREQLNQVYADEMKKAYEAFPDDPDVAALYADALMLQHPWDLWNINGTPKPWTPAIREVLEKLLSHTPQHPGANHYYIHVMEASPDYALALPSADRLGSLTPGLSHTVHMPSHIYLRAGHYLKGTTVNEEAIGSYKKMIPLYEAVTGNVFLYVIHNLHMQTNNSILAARDAYSVKSAQETAESIPLDYLSGSGALANYIQYVYGTPVLVNVKFGHWEELLKMAKPDKQFIYSNVLYRFGRGMAFSGKMEIPAAKEELKILAELMTDSSLYLPFPPFSTAIEGVRVAHDLLAGTIALKEKRFNEAISLFDAAVSTEERMVYNEPRDWMLNSGQYLGNALFLAGRYEEARSAFIKDLERNNENPWSLYGLWKSLQGLGQTIEAGSVWARFKKASELSDIKFPVAVF